MNGPIYQRYFSMEQFCTYECANNFLEKARGLKHVMVLPSESPGKGDFRHLE